MKTKCRPGDFIVRESVNLPLTGGAVAAYSLTKTGIGTPEALGRIARRWNLAGRRISHAGLKDRHAITTQTITVTGGPREDMRDADFDLQYLGQTNTSVSARHLTANEFDIRVRDLELGKATRMQQLAMLPGLVVPSYFDKQRFGSVGFSGEFVAQPWCRGDYERAVYLALAEANRSDSREEREQKAILRKHWGDWENCKANLHRSNRRSVVTFLVDHPTKFKKAAALIDRGMRSIFVSAFQARLWNEVASQWLAQQANTPKQSASKVAEKPADLLTPSGKAVAQVELQSDSQVTGRLFFPPAAAASSLDEFRSATIPLPSSRPTRWQPDIREILTGVCREFNLEVHQLRFSYPRDVFFSRAARRVFLACQDVSAEIAGDELAACQRTQLHLRFRLAPGQYATMLIKGIATLAATCPDVNRGQT